MGHDSADLTKHVSVSRDQSANSSGNPIYVHVVNQSEVTTALNTERLALQSALDSALQDIEDVLFVTIEGSLSAIETTITALDASGDANSAAEIAALTDLRDQLLLALANLQAANDASGDDIVAAIQALELSNETDFAATIAAINTSRDQIVAAIQALEAANDLSGDDIVTAIQTSQTAITNALTTLEAEVDSIGTDIVAEIQAQKALLDSALQDVENLIQAEMDQTQVILNAINTTLTDGTMLSQTELWEALKTGTAPSLGHEFRMDSPLTVYRYHAYATRGTATSALSWTVMRIEFTNLDKEESIRFLVNENMAWDDRVSGGTQGW